MSLYTDSVSNCSDLYAKFQALEALPLDDYDPTGTLSAAVSDLHDSANTGLGTLAGHLNVGVGVLIGTGGDSKPPS